MRNKRLGFAAVLLAFGGLFAVTGLTPFGSGVSHDRVDQDVVQSGRSHGLRVGRDDASMGALTDDLDRLARWHAGQTKHSGAAREVWERAFRAGYLDAYEFTMKKRRGAAIVDKM